MIPFFRKKQNDKKNAAPDVGKIVENEGLPDAAPEVDSATAPEEKSKPWIGVDLDGTLAEWTGWKGLDNIGKPIPLMLARVKFWLERGITVKIFTARASDEANGIPPIKKWLADNGLPELEITNKKDFDMVELWDDRVIQVVQNTGKPFLSMFSAGRPAAPILPNEDSSSTFYLLKKPAPPAGNGGDNGGGSKAPEQAK